MSGVIKTVTKPFQSIFGRSAGAQATSDPIVDPALLSPEQVNVATQRLLNLTGTPPQRFGQVPVGIQQSSFFNPFSAALTDRFTPTAAENQLIEDVAGRTSAEFARRGLGASPIAGSGVASSIAPALVALRQNVIGNLANALGLDLSGQQLGLTQRAQNIGADLNQRQLQIGGLLDLLNFGRRQPVGQISRGAQPGIFRQILPQGVPIPSGDGDF